MLDVAQRRRFLELIAGMIPTVNQHRPDDAEVDDYTGAWVCIRDREEGDATMLHESVGAMEAEPSARRREVSRLKVTMLCEAPEGVEATYEMRDPSRQYWGGGFTIGGKVDVAVSGLPEKWDMATGLYAANKLGMINHQEVDRLATKAPGVAECLEILDRVDGIMI